MRTTVTLTGFVDAFRLMERRNQFSLPALEALFAYLEDYEFQVGVDLEFDPIGICCEWTEYRTCLEAAQAYGFQVSLDDNDETPREWLQNRTPAVELRVGHGVVVQNF